MFGCESCQDIRIYFGGQFCRRGHLHPLKNSKSEMMSYVGGGWCCNTRAELERPPWIHVYIYRKQRRFLEKVSSLNIFGQITVEGVSSGVFRMQVFVQANLSSTSTGQTWKTENARISRVLWSTRCREVAENEFLPRNKKSSRETTKKWASCHLAPGVRMFL